MPQQSIRQIKPITNATNVTAITTATGKKNGSKVRKILSHGLVILRSLTSQYDIYHFKWHIHFGLFHFFGCLR